MGGDQCSGDEAEDEERDSIDRVQDQTGSSKYEYVLRSISKFLTCGSLLLVGLCFTVTVSLFRLKM